MSRQRAKVSGPTKIEIVVRTTTTPEKKKRPKRREMKPEQAAGFAKKEAIRRLGGRARYFGERF